MNELELGQTVQVDRGVLAGLIGEFVGIRGDKSLIELDVIPSGPLLLVDSLAVSAVLQLLPSLPLSCPKESARHAC